MPRIDGGGRSIPPQAINSSDSVQNTEETKPSNSTETASSNLTERKTPINTRAVAEHKLTGNLQQMELNSQLDLLPLKGSVKQEWQFFDRFPTKWDAPEPHDPLENNIQTESLEITHQDFKEIKDPSHKNITSSTSESKKP